MFFEWVALRSLEEFGLQVRLPQLTCFQYLIEMTAPHSENGGLPNR